jgi:hypothetical protein
MALTNKYTMANGRLPDLFEKIRDGQAPDQFTQQLLKDWGFTSSNDRAMLPMLKDLGFLSPDGKPTTRYHDYRNHSRSKAVMADALHEAYYDIFLIKEQPSDADKPAIKGKFKSFHNVSDNVASLMMKTFFALLNLSDHGAIPSKATVKAAETEVASTNPDKTKSHPEKSLVESGHMPSQPALHYNIQIHLPASKDVEVYNAIFKSLREHLIE